MGRVSAFLSPYSGCRRNTGYETLPINREGFSCLYQPSVHDNGFMDPLRVSRLERPSDVAGERRGDFGDHGRGAFTSW